MQLSYKINMNSYDSSYPLINNFNSLDFHNLNFWESKYSISKNSQKPSPFEQNGKRILSKVNTLPYKKYNLSPYSKEISFFQNKKISDIDNFLFQENDYLFSKNNIKKKKEKISLIIISIKTKIILMTMNIIIAMEI